jgi:phage tail-like protein
MPPFSVNADRVDPYKNFKFRLKWDGQYVAGVSKVSALRRVTEVVTHREGGDPSTAHKSPGQTQFEAITIERGITHDVAFEAWANKVFDPAHAGGPGPQMSLADFRKDIFIELYNEAGQLVMAYRVRRCWPSEYEAVADLEAGASGVAIQRLVLQNEGWERDTSIVEPAEPRTAAPKGKGAPAGTGTP